MNRFDKKNIIDNILVIFVIISRLMLQIFFDFKHSRKNLQVLQDRLDHHILQAIKFFDNKDWAKCQSQLKVISKKSQVYLNNTLKKMPKVIQIYWQIVKYSFSINPQLQIQPEKWEPLTQQNIYERPFYQILQYYGNQSNKGKLLYYCEKLLNNFPSNDMAYYYKGKTLIQQKQFENGIILLKLGHDLNRKNQKINLYLSSYYEQKKYYMYCIKYLQYLKESDPLNKEYIDKCFQIRKLAQQQIQKAIALKKVFQKQILSNQNGLNQQVIQKQQKLASNNQKLSSQSIQIGGNSQPLAQQNIWASKNRIINHDKQKQNKLKSNFIQTIKTCLQRIEQNPKNNKIFDQILQNMKTFVHNVVQQQQADHLAKLFHKMMQINRYNMMVPLLAGQFYVLRNQKQKACEALKKAKMLIFIDKQKSQTLGKKKQIIQNYLLLLYKFFEQQKIDNKYLSRQLQQLISTINAPAIKQLQLINKLVILKNKIIQIKNEQITTIMYIADLLPRRVDQYLNEIFLREQRVYLVNNLREFREKIIRCKTIIAFPETLPFLGQETENLKNIQLTVLVVDTKINEAERQKLIKQSRNIKYTNFRINIEVNKPFAKIFQIARNQEEKKPKFSKPK